MRNIIYSLLIISSLSLLSCEDDNSDLYSEPISELSGTLTNDITGRPYASGSRIFEYYLTELGYLEDGGTSPRRQYGAKGNGTYKNTRLFAVKYLLEIRGAFYLDHDMEIDLSTGNVVKDFTVVPYLGINNMTYTRSSDGTEIVASFNFVRHARVEAEDLLTFKRVIQTFGNISRYPTVSNDIYERNIGSAGRQANDVVITNEAEDIAFMNSDISYTFTGLDPDLTYYFIGGGRAQVNEGGTNWSEVLEMQ